MRILNSLRIVFIVVSLFASAVYSGDTVTSTMSASLDKLLKKAESKKLNPVIVKASGESSGGGDPDEIEFVSIGSRIADMIRTKGGDILSYVDPDQLVDAVKATKVRMTDDILMIDDEERVAINSPEFGAIRVNRPAYKELIGNANKKISLVMHEYLGIMRVNDKNYEISSMFLNQLEEANRLALIMQEKTNTEDAIKYFCAAAMDGNVATLKRYLQLIPYVDARCNDKGQTALVLAIVNDHAEAVEYLLGAGAMTSAKDKDGRFPIHIATQGSKIKMVQLLLEFGADPNAIDGVFFTYSNGEFARHLSPDCLTWGVLNNRVEVVKLLLNAGAKWAQEPAETFNLLNVYENRNAEIHKIMVEGGIKNTKILIAAVKQGELAFVEPYLANGFDVNEYYGGKTLLGHALEKADNDEMVRFLIDRGADLNKPISQGSQIRLIHKALKLEDDLFKIILDGTEVATLNTSDASSHSPLISAILEKSISKTQMLLEAGADPKRIENALAGENILKSGDAMKWAKKTSAPKEILDLLKKYSR